MNGITIAFMVMGSRDQRLRDQRFRLELNSFIELLAFSGPERRPVAKKHPLLGREDGGGITETNNDQEQTTRTGDGTGAQ